MKKCKTCLALIPNNRTFCTECIYIRKKKTNHEHTQKKQDLTKKNKYEINPKYLTRGNISTGSKTSITGG